jgi:hypothetical protein
MTKCLSLAAIVLLFFSGCAIFRSGDPSPEDSPPPSLGIVRFINRPEHYLIFEAERPIPAGTGLLILREGRRVGAARVGTQQNRKFQTADILDGAPDVLDVVQPRSRP